MSVTIQFANAVAEAFHAGVAYYGEIGLAPDLFTAYVWSISAKHLSGCSDECALAEFAKRLYLRDLYLTCGCVSNSENAWKTFDVRYRRFIADLVRFCYRHGTDNEEVADTILVSLCLPDRSGRLRIASYDGRSSLATWLRVIVINRAINDHNERKIVNDDAVIDIPDNRATVNIESAILAGRYAKVMTASLKSAFQTLTSRERLMLLWRYEENLQLGEIAKLLGIHQSNVTRRLVRLQARLREFVIQTLTSKYHLSASAIEECLADIMDNPHVSIPLVRVLKYPTKLAADSARFQPPSAASARIANAAEGKNTA